MAMEQYVRIYVWTQDQGAFADQISMKWTVNVYHWSVIIHLLALITSNDSCIKEYLFKLKVVHSKLIKYRTHELKSRKCNLFNNLVRVV